MAPTTTLLLLFIGFAATHMILSSVRLRPRLVARLGEPAYLGLFSVVALAFFVPLVWIYFDHKHAGPWLWTIPRGPVLTWILYAVNGVAFVLAASSFTQPNPSMMGAGPGEARGVFRIARHPLFMGTALFGAAHLVVNASTADVVFFGGIVAFSVVGSLHQDRRKLATGVLGYAAFHAATPFVPFTGRETLRGLRELSPIGIGIGLALAVVLRVFHANLFGP